MAGRPVVLHRRKTRSVPDANAGHYAARQHAIRLPQDPDDDRVRRTDRERVLTSRAGRNGTARTGPTGLPSSTAMAPQRLSLPPAVAANPLARPVPRPQQKRKKKQDGIRGPGGVRYGLAHHLDEPSELTEANPVRRRRKAMRRVDSHKPVFTDLMKAAAVVRVSKVRSSTS